MIKQRIELILVSVYKSVCNARSVHVHICVYECEHLFTYNATLRAIRSWVVRN